MADSDPNGKVSGRPTLLLVVAIGFLVLSAGMFVGMTYLPAALTASYDVQVIVAMSLRLMGFAALLGAGWALYARSSR